MALIDPTVAVSVPPFISEAHAGKIALQGKLLHLLFRGRRIKILSWGSEFAIRFFVMWYTTFYQLARFFLYDW